MHLIVLETTPTEKISFESTRKTASSVQLQFEMTSSLPSTHPGLFVLDMDDQYVSDLVRTEMSQHYSEKWSLYEPKQDPSDPLLTTTQDGTYIPVNSQRHTIFYTEYETVDWDTIESNPNMMSSIWYTTRKGLIRKAELARTIEQHTQRCPEHAPGDVDLNQLALNLDILDDENWYYLSDVDDDDDDEDDENNENVEHSVSKQQNNHHSSDDENGSTTEPELNEEDADKEENSDGDDDNEDDSSDVSTCASSSQGDDQSNSPFVSPVFKHYESCCPLQCHVPTTIVFTLHHAGEIDELLISELPEILSLDQQSEQENIKNGNFWIMKPSLTNQAKGIYLITSSQSFHDVFNGKRLQPGENIQDVLSIRTWAIQKYIHPPFLTHLGRKFHLRVYAYALSSCFVYIFDRFLALFSLKQYQNGSNEVDPSVHITNTCYQKRTFFEQCASPEDNFHEDKCVSLFHTVIEEWAAQMLSLVPINHHPVTSLSHPQNDTAPAQVNTSSNIHIQQVRYLRHILRSFIAIWDPSSSSNNDTSVLSDNIDENSPQPTDAADDTIPSLDFSSPLACSKDVFVFFFKRLIRQFSQSPTSSLSYVPSTSLALLFPHPDRPFEMDIAQCSKQIALHIYHHVLAQIRTIIQELFIACHDINLGVSPTLTRHDFSPPVSFPSNSSYLHSSHPVLDPDTFQQIVDDRLDEAELVEKQLKYFGPSHRPMPTAAMLERRTRTMSTVQYRSLLNSSELYGFDFMVDARCKVYLIEANPGPDFGQTGQRLKHIVCEPLVRGVISLLLQDKLRRYKLQLQTATAAAVGEPDNNTDSDDKLTSIEQLIERNEPLAPQYHASYDPRLAAYDFEEQKMRRSQIIDADSTTSSHRVDIEDYIGTPGKTSWEIPTAPHFVPVLYLPL